MVEFVMTNIGRTTTALVRVCIKEAHITKLKIRVHFKNPLRVYNPDILQLIFLEFYTLLRKRYRYFSNESF